MAHFLFLGQASSQAPTATEAMGGIDMTGMVVFKRDIDNSYPMQPGGQLYVSNKFGLVRVTTWDNPVVSLKATVRVGAENLVQAERFAQAIAVDGNQVENRLELRTVYPEVTEGDSLGYTVDFHLSVPTNLNLSIDNHFGDTSVTGLAGDLSVDSSYGAVRLTSIGGRASVRAKGDFPLEVRGLPAGGTFFLRSTPSTFSDIGGSVSISNYLGTIDVMGLHESCELIATCDNGPIRVTLPDGAAPDLRASAEFGDVEIGIPAERQRWGKRTLITAANPEATQRISLDTSFASIFVRVQAIEAPPEVSQQLGTEPVQEIVRQEVAYVEGQTIVLDSMPGVVTFEATDDPAKVSVEATRFVRVSDVKNAPAAMESLASSVVSSEKEIRILTEVAGDVANLGIAEIKTHLRIQHPVTAPLRIVHDSGMLTIRGAGGSVHIEQNSGDVILGETAGEVDVQLASGSVTLRDTLGSVTARVEEGDIRTFSTLGALTLETARGKIVIDDPRAGVFGRNSRGDVRVIALEGLFGDFDIQTENGNINMVIPPTSDALLLLSTQGGTVYSSFPVTGTLEKRDQSFQGRLNEATHRLVLQANQGNIVLD